MPNKTITFGADLLPNSTSLEYNLGNSTQLWKIYGSLSGQASAASVSSTTNAVSIYSDTAGTFSHVSSSNGALYATTSNGSVTFGILPIAQGGTGATSITANRILQVTGTSLTATGHYVSTTAIAVNTTTAQTENFYVNGTAKITTGFQYSGIGTATNNSYTEIWFNDSASTGKPVINSNFTYNPSVGHIRVGNGYEINQNVTMQWNATDNSLDFIFA